MSSDLVTVRVPVACTYSPRPVRDRKSVPCTGRVLPPDLDCTPQGTEDSEFRIHTRHGPRANHSHVCMVRYVWRQAGLVPFPDAPSQKSETVELMGT